MMDNNVTSFGKIQYIEPNDILNNNIYKDDNESYNITHSYEDYSLSVDLVVKIPNRYGGAKNESNTHTISLGNKNFNGDNISFFSGKDGFFTDNPGSTTYYDILNGNGENTKESLGITSINIRYNSYFYPEVTIKFTDIRGSALMMPLEENYRRQQINKDRKETVYNTQVESFFSALFNFPSPEFILQIKGFYGKKVEYSLIIEDFRSSFNNNTGNFDATVKFIGKMYGVYTDIPMSYLLIAPYCKYGGTNNQTIWQKHNFTFDNITPIPTFTELKDRVITANHNLKTQINQDTSLHYKKCNTKKNLLQDIENEYNKIKRYLESKQNVVFGDEVFLCECNDNVNRCEYLYLDNSNLFSITQKLITLITNYNKEYDTKISQLIGLESLNKKIGEDGYNTTVITKNKGDYNLSFSKKNNFDITQYPYLKDNLSKYFSGKPDKSFASFAILSASEFKSSLKKEIDNTREELKKIEEDANNEAELRIIEILGFAPTIKNVFKILMAHLQTFIEIYVSFLSNVTGVNARNLKKHNLSLANTCDLNENVIASNDAVIPPFPSIKNNLTNTFCYPNTDIIKGVMEETKLIDSLFSGGSSYIDELSLSNRLENELNDNSIEMIPTCLTDLFNISNPYDINFNDSYSDIHIDVLFTYFGIRCISKLMLEQNKNISLEEFGKCEAYNFWRVNKNLKQEIINKIKNNTCNAENFIGFLLGNKNNPYILNGKPYYSNNSKTTKLLVKGTDSNDKLMLSGDYNFPAVIGRDSGNINLFFEDITDNSGKYSFLNGDSSYCRPYAFIDYIPQEHLEEINNGLNSLDTEKYCSKDAKYTLVEHHTKITKDMFNDKFVYYRKNKQNNFIQTYGSIDSYLENNNLKLNEVYNNNFNEGELECIHDKNNTPIFFTENLTADEFLSAIPHNIKKLASLIRDGKCVITIPYLTQLYIGMILKKLYEADTINNFKLYYDNFVIYNLNLTSLESLNYLNDIFTIISAFVRDEKGRYNEKGLILYGGSEKQTLNLMFNFKTYYKNDYLGLIKQYEEWSNSNQRGGFQYLKDRYTLIDMTNKTVNDKNRWIYIVNGKTICDSKGDNIYERLVNLCKRYTDSLRDDNNILNECYKPLKHTINSKSPFTDRYSNIHLVRYNRNTYYVHLSFNEKFDAYESLEELFKKQSKLVIPYQMKPYYDNTITNSSIETKPNVPQSEFVTAFNAFKKQVLDLYDKTDSRGEEKNNNFDETSENQVNEDSKLSMYRTLKNLYDKHFSDLIDKQNLYDIENENGEFGRFHFIDTFYRDLSNEFKFNMNTLIEVLNILNKGFQSPKGDGLISSDMSLYSFMSLLCQKHNMMLLAMPVFNSRNDVDNLSKMFTPLTFNETLSDSPTNNLHGPSYVCFYPHQASQHLDLPNSQYANDGFDIVDMNDTGSFVGPIQIPDLQLESDEDYIIPAFGVEYGSQKQSIFKNINVNMDNPQTTEASVANMFYLANRNNEDMSKLRFNGQDLFKIYSNYSFTCQVEMMGCAQIQPLMYFQLNNIPMFRGAYQIIQVEHDIKPGDMTTRFKGVRINRTKIPMTKYSLSCANMKDILGAKETSFKNNKIKPLNIKDMKPADTRVHFMTTDFNVDSTKLLTDYPSHVMFRDGQKERFNQLNPALRKLMYCIVGDLKELSKSLPYKLGIIITSSTREAEINGNGGSDHLINGSPSQRRILLKDENGIPYSKLGCAIDFVGTKNGKPDYSEASINIYSLIAKNYTEYIRQLIWEVDGFSPKQNCISVIHLASYGKRGANGSDKTEIFVSEKSKNYAGSQTKPEELSSEFLKILTDMSVDGKLKNTNDFANVRVNNFPSIPTTSNLQKLYNNALNLA